MALFGSINATFKNDSSLAKNDLESIWNKIMSPIKKEVDPNLVAQFCFKLNNDLDGAQTAVDLITNKMQSNQEWEAIIALYVLEACVKNCGEKFHELIGRFRFLNEMIKLVSPKYYANRTSEKVKKKVIELLYSWTESLPQNKIKEAYQMLKNQGIITNDPTYVEKLVIEIAPRIKNPIFEDEEKSKQLARLLKSKNPQDLELANRLIKNMVKQDEIKIEKTSLRINELEHINNNMKLLGEMLNNFNRSTANESEIETIKYLYEELIKLRPNLVKLATDTDDNDDAIGDILKANDQCEKIINQYESIFDKSSGLNNNKLLIDNDVNLVNISTNSSLMHEDQFDQISGSKNQNSNNKHQTSYDPLKELEDLFSKPKISSQSFDYDMPNSYTSSNDNLSNTSNTMGGLMQPIILSSSNTDILSTANSTYQNSLINKNKNETIKAQTPQIKALNELNELGRSLMEKSLNDPKVSLNEIVASASDKQSFSQPQSNKILSLNEIHQKKIESTNIMQKSLRNEQPINEDEMLSAPTNQTNELFNSLNALFVKLESIKPSNIPPVNLYEKNNVKLVLHFARDSPMVNINVIVLTVTSSNTDTELKNFNFQAAVPKSMKIKLQPASRSDLPAFNPILPPTAITQIMLIANPNKDLIRLKYKISYSFNDAMFNETDEVKSLPLQINDLI